VSHYRHLLLVCSLRHSCLLHRTLLQWQQAARVCYRSNLLNGIKQCGALLVTSGVNTKTRNQAP